MAYDDRDEQGTQGGNGGANDLAAAERMPADLMLLKMENEQIFSVARMRPRDPVAIVKQLQSLLDAYPAAADEAIYSKPVGTVMSITCACGLVYEAGIKWVSRRPVAEQEPCVACGKWNPQSERAVKKFAEGLSVRAAESIRSVFGYTRLSTQTEEMTDGKVKLTGTMVDYAAGNLTSDQRIISPYYRARSGEIKRTPEDRFLDVVVKAEKAKLRRDIILDSVPNIIKAMFRDACEQKLMGLIAPEIIEQKILPVFAQYGIGAEELDKIIGQPRALGWREEHRLAARKIASALKNNETTAGELLRGIDTEGSPDNEAVAADLVARLSPSAAPANTLNPDAAAKRIRIRDLKLKAPADVWAKALAGVSMTPLELGGCDDLPTLDAIIEALGGGANAKGGAA